MARKLSGADAIAGKAAMYVFALWFGIDSPFNPHSKCFDYFKEFKRFLSIQQKSEIMISWQKVHRKELEEESMRSMVKSTMEAVFV